jgi:hypothetical protein
MHSGIELGPTPSSYRRAIKGDAMRIIKGYGIRDAEGVYPSIIGAAEQAAQCADYCHNLQRAQGRLAEQLRAASEAIDTLRATLSLIEGAAAGVEASAIAHGAVHGTCEATRAR